MHERKGTHVARCLLEECRRRRWGARIDRQRDRYCAADLTVTSIERVNLRPPIDLQLTYLLYDPRKLEQFLDWYARRRLPPWASARVYVGLDDNGRNLRAHLGAMARELARFSESPPHPGSVQHLEVRADGKAIWRDPEAHLRYLYERRTGGFRSPRQFGTVIRTNGSAFVVREESADRPREALIYYTSLERQAGQTLAVGTSVSFKTLGRTNCGLPVGEYALIE